MEFTARHALLGFLAWCAVGPGGFFVPTLFGQTPPTASRAKLLPEQLDGLIAHETSGQARPVRDDDFLRRASFDLIGRQPTPTEQQAFAADQSSTKRRDTIERLLASEEFGANWANYWRDTIAYRVPPPELTYLNYAPLRGWLAAKLNNNTPWDQVVRELLTAQGKIEDQPAATFIGYHQAEPTNLAGETSRIFLGQQIGCAQCHDHPFDHWKRTQFHELAAFFARAKSKLSQNDGVGTVVSSVDKGEYLMPDIAEPRNKGRQMAPGFLDGKNPQAGPTDAERRAKLAEWVTSRDNPWFALAYTNRVWGRLMGRGFYEPVDNLGDSSPQMWPAVHEGLSGHFVATDFDVKDLYRLIMNTEAYAQGLRPSESPQNADPALAGSPLRLRGDEVFAALKVGIDLPNVTPQKVEPTGAIRFPPPPKSTQDLINDAFGTDPSLTLSDAPRTMGQALWMMNNEQLQKQINAAPDSGTMLAKLLQEQTDNRIACEQLFSRVLARAITAEELRISLLHIAEVGNRQAGFEDLLWSLVNTAEFTTRR